jgi:hypothetical protein
VARWKALVAETEAAQALARPDAATREGKRFARVKKDALRRKGR